MFTAIRTERENFELKNAAENSEILKFDGVGDNTVYNCSVPLIYGGETYIFGRVEKKEIWANSHSVLFRLEKDGVFRPDHRFIPFGLEDPFWEKINGEYILGGNIVFRNVKGKDNSFRTMFFRSKDIFEWYHFAVGPEMMKDIRLVQLPEGKVGVFSRPRSEEVEKNYGSKSLVGFTVINSVDELNADVIENAENIEDFFGKDEWGGVNQAFYLGDGKIGIIGHQCYSNIGIGIEKPCYLCISCVFDIKTHRVYDKKIIATRKSFPAADVKIPGHRDCAFPSGIVFRDDGKADLYCGLSDMFEGKKTIEDPFSAYKAENKRYAG